MPTDPSSSRTRPLVTRRRFLKWSGAAGVAAASGAYWSIGPTVRRTRAAAPADTPLKHVVVSMQENRSFDHYFGYAPWIGAYGPPAGYTPARRLGRAPSRRTTSRASRHPTSRTTGTPSTTSGTAARWTASTRMRASGRSATTRRPISRSTTASTTTRRSRSTTSARCWGRPGRIASITWPGRRAGSRPTACGATASSTTR